MGYIYKISNTLNDKLYIGQTINPINYRWSDHKYSVKKLKTPLYNKMREVKDNIDEFFKIEIIEEVDDILLDEREIYWIKELNSLHPNGYNMSEGGQSYLTEEERRRISERLTGENNPMYGKIGELNPFYGKKHSEETKAILREKALTRGFSEEHKRKISEGLILRHKKLEHPMKGKHHSDESKKKIAKKLKNRYFSEEHRAKISANSKKKRSVDMYDLKGNYLMTFESQARAGDWLRENTKFDKKHYCAISTVCSGGQKTAYGFKWKYSGD